MDKKNKTAVITGVTGQDGSYLTEMLLESGYNVVGWLRRSSTNHVDERLSQYLKDPLFHLVEVDLTDMGSVSGAYNTSKQILEGAPREFYNLAAQSHVGTSFNQKDFTTSVNLNGVYHTIDAIINAGDVKTVRYYQASTSEMFGSNFDFVGPNSLRIQSEKTAFAPNSPYAIAKTGAHYAIQMYRSGYGLHASCGILFNHESPRRGEHFVTRKITKYVASLVKWLKQWRTPSCLFLDDAIFHVRTSDDDNLIPDKFPKLRLGNMAACRDWSHAKDMVYGMWLMLQQEKPGDYVLASGETHSVEEFVKLCFQYVNIDNYSDYIYIDKDLYRPVEVEYLRGDWHKATIQLGWMPEYSFGDLVSDMMEAELG